jgi:aspartate aminotransferase
MNLEGVDDKVVLIDSVSKRYSMCGARIGALVSKNSKLIATALKFGQARLSPPTFGQVAGEAAIETPDSYFEEVVEEYVQRRNYLVMALNEIPGVICPNPGGAFYTVAKLPVENAEHFCQWMLSEFDYKGQTVMMAPAEGFYMTEGLGKSEVRIAYVLKIEDLRASVECLKVGLEQYAQVFETIEK